MKRNMKRFLAFFLAFVMAATPVTSLQAEDVGTQEDAPVEVGKTQEDIASAGEEVQEDAPAKDQVNTADEDATEDVTGDTAEDAAAVEEENEPKDENSANAEQKEEETPVTGNEQAEADTLAVEEDTETPVKPAEAITGVKVVKNDGSTYGMFPISDVICSIKGNQIEIAFHTGAKKIFDRLYLGYKTDADKSGYFAGNNTGSTCEFTIRVPLSQKNSWIPVSVGRSDKGTWSDNYLWMSIPNVLTLTQQPQSVSCKAGEIVNLSVSADGSGVTYQWQYSTDGTTWTDCTAKSARTASYSFAMSSELSGQYRCFVKDELGTEVVSDVVEVKLEKTGEQEGFKADGKITAIYASDDEKKPGKDYTMFRIASSQAVVKGEEIEVTIWVAPASSGKFSYDAIYIGYKDDDPKEPIVLGEVDTERNLQRYTFRVPMNTSGGEVHFVPRSASKGTWSVKSSLALKIPALTEFVKPSVITIVTQPEKEVTAGKGAMVSLSVEASAEEGRTLSYQWQYSPDGTTWTNCTDQGAQTASYSFAMAAELAGQYRCVITDSDGTTVISQTATVSEPSAPIVTGNAVRVVKQDGSDFTMFKVKDSKVVRVGDNLEVTISTTNKSFNKLYLGSKDDALKTPVIWGTALEAAGWTFSFRVPADHAGKVCPVALGKTDESWYSNMYLWIYIPDEGIQDTPIVTEPDPKPEGKIPSDGSYKVDVESSASMFRVIDCKLTVKDGKMSAVLTLSGQGYGYLYMGTKEEAAKADPVAWIPYVVNSDGKYTYTIPVEALDRGVAVAAYSTSKGIWYDRTLTFLSGTLKKLSDSAGDGNPGITEDTGNNSSGSSAVLPPNDGKADSESRYEADVSGSTRHVNSSTTLADGVYVPDAFTWSGGTGKVKIYCNKISVINGQAYATLVFDSENYQYVKANGNIYYTTKGNGKATVVIPIALNKNNQILAMTTKMSNAHEIAYTIFVYLAGAGGSKSMVSTTNAKLDEEAPEIMGLRYESETELDYAEYFKIYHYDQGVTLLEVDMAKDTAGDSKQAEAENTEQTNVSDKTAKAAETAEDGEVSVSQEEMTAELYKGNVVKYLLVPDGVEVPVGLEQDMLVVQMPVDKAYVSENAILEKMDELGLTDYVAAIGCEMADCKVASISQRMEKKDDEEKAEVVYGGTWEDPEFKELVKQETNLAILPSAILPQEADDTDAQADDEKLTVKEQRERFEKITEKFALLGIPAIVDRSEDEKTDLAKYEWVKVFGVLFGCEEEMAAFFETKIAEAGADADSQVRTQSADQTSK